ncbi:recombinase family protein [Microvirga sp. KLBC 81]|uniref:recombinase family protein n=1 Tax=Microvirga sp. KLBC 81 TaxID=1862707 RepID=UPI00352C664D
MARSASHLLKILEAPEERGAHFRSLRDLIDISTPQGMVSLQVLAVVAQLGRSLICEHTKGGVRAAKARGKVLGNPGVRERRPNTIRRLILAREKRYLDPDSVDLTSGCPPRNGGGRPTRGMTLSVF